MRYLLAVAALSLPLSALALGRASNVAAPNDANANHDDVGVEQSAIQLAQLRVGSFGSAGVVTGQTHDEDDRVTAYTKPDFTRRIAGTSEVQADIAAARAAWDALYDGLPNPPFPRP